MKAHLEGDVLYRRAELGDVGLPRRPLLGEALDVIAHESVPPFKTVGTVACSVVPVHVNGRPERAGYLSGFRGGFDSARVVANALGPAPYWFASAAPGAAARPEGVLAELTLSTRRGRESGRLKSARRHDAHDLAEFYNRHASRYQFSPQLDSAWLSRLDAENGLALDDFWLAVEDGDVRGCVAVWDLRAVRPDPPARYEAPMTLMRLPYNAWAAATRRPLMPRPGRALSRVHLAFLAADDDGVALDLIREGLGIARRLGADAASIGLADENPLSKKAAVRFGALRRDIVIESLADPGGAETPLDGRPPQPEAALL
ncbi:MAG: hypothetical protein HY059_22095 [Proteobacteria bacterium]|nr:hypothetical protein [Pseudomonadota bacterium]